MCSSIARVSRKSLSLPVPVSVYFVEKIPVLRTERLRRFRTMRDEALSTQLSGVLFRAVHDHLGARCGADLVSEGLADTLHLRHTLERKEEGHFGSARGLQYLGETRIGKGSDLVKKDAQHRLIRITHRCRLRVS